MLDASSAELVVESDFPLVAEDGRRFRRLPLRNTNKKFNPLTAPTLHFAIWGDPETGEVRTSPFDGAVEIKPVFGDGSPAVWRWSRPRIDERPDDLVCRWVRGVAGDRIDVFQRDWRHPTGGARRKKMRTIWLSEEIGSTDTAVAELKEVLGHVFESPKPTGLVRRILDTMPDDVRVLDYFAGSGTTGHAVALANAADGGRRTCLSINHPEPVRPGSNADLAGYRTVADITRARLQAVAERVGGGLAESAGSRAIERLALSQPTQMPGGLLQRGELVVEEGQQPLQVRDRTAAAGEAEAHAAVVRRAGDVERHAVDRDRQRVVADQLGAVPVVRWCAGPGTLLMIRLYGDRMIPCIFSAGPRIAGAWPIALIARICTGVSDLSASLPSFIDFWTAWSRSPGSAWSVPSRAITAPTALPPSADGRWDSLAFSPTGTIATSGVSGSASFSMR